MISSLFLLIYFIFWFPLLCNVIEWNFSLMLLTERTKTMGVVIGYYVKCYWISVVHTKAIINIMRKFSFLLPFPTRCELFFNDFDCTIWTEIRSLSYNKCVVSEASFFEKKKTFLQFYFSLNGLSKNTFSHFFYFWFSILNT